MIINFYYYSLFLLFLLFFYLFFLESYSLSLAVPVIPSEEKAPDSAIFYISLIFYLFFLESYSLSLAVPVVPSEEKAPDSARASLLEMAQRLNKDLGTLRDAFGDDLT